MWLFNFFLLVRTLKQKLQKWQLGPRGIWLSCSIAPPGCPGYPLRPSFLFPSISSLSSSSSFFSSSSSFFSPYFRRHGRPRGPPSSPAGTFRTCTEISPYRPGSSPPSPGSKIMTGLKLFTIYKIVTCFTRVWFSDVCHLGRKKTWKTNTKTKKKTKEQKKELKIAKKNR